MRWEGLFDDLEGQLAAEERRELDDEVAERTRRERALVTLEARLAAAAGSGIRLRLVDGTRVDGVLDDRGRDWVLVRKDGGRDVLVPIASVVTLTALQPRGRGPRHRPTVRARLRAAGTRARPGDRGGDARGRWPRARRHHRRRGRRPPRPRGAPRGGAASPRERHRGDDGAVRRAGERRVARLTAPPRVGRGPIDRSAVRSLESRSTSSPSRSDRVVTRSRVSAYMRWM